MAARRVCTIDGGRSQSRIEERLTALGITDLDAIMATHPDADHIAGLIRVLELYTVETVYLNGGTSATQTLATFMAAVPPRTPTWLHFRGATLSCLAEWR